MEDNQGEREDDESIGGPSLYGMVSEGMRNGVNEGLTNGGCIDGWEDYYYLLKLLNIFVCN